MPEQHPFLQHLTHDPGVYRMLDATGTVLYVGKAIDLKKRVGHYFQKNLTHPKTQALVGQISNVDVTITRNETEAFLLESNLIKTLKPKYNILLRDDKTYPYLLIQTQHPFPKMTIYRGKQRPKTGKAFGPFPSTAATHETLHTLQKCFKLRNCHDATFASRTRPCLQYQIKRCTAPCTQFISQKDYQDNVQQTLEFLQGKSSRVIEQLSQAMDTAASLLQFEKAAVLREKIKQLRLIQQAQPIIQGHQDVDIIVIHADEANSCVEHVIIRQGHVLHNQAYFPKLPKHSLDLDNLWSAVFEAFIRFYYIDNTVTIPPLILTESTLPQATLKAYETLLSTLRKSACHLQNKAKGPQKGWLDFALNNLHLHIKQHLTQSSRHEALEDYFKLTLKQLVCFDVSHTQGQQTQASCVVFNEKGPDKSNYRRFNIQGQTQGDDYAALEHALTRYFKRLLNEKQPLPELLLIDGGKGQVHVAQQVLKTLNINTIKLLGITKGEHRKACFDRIFDANTNAFLELAPDSLALHRLQHLRDEAHRFAIFGHRKQRDKTLLSSSLETIEGIGPKKRKALIQYFGGLKDLVKAPLNELLKVPGINKALAERIQLHFQK